MSNSKLLKLCTEEVEKFESVYTELLDVLVGDEKLDEMSETLSWLEQVLQYNVPHGKKVRGLLCLVTYQQLVPNATEQDIKLASVLGWCLEIMQAAFLVGDDIVDESSTRRGTACWYLVDGKGTLAFNDAHLLLHGVYRILRKYFDSKRCHSELRELFLKVTYDSILGESMDIRIGNERNIDDYTVEKYATIVKYKTSYYSIYLPVALAMAMAELTDEKLKANVEHITLQIGHLFQVQDDYLDCFGDPTVTGKIGTDIQDAKCSWLLVSAKESCSPEQYQLLKENYGWDDAEKVAKVKELFGELKLRERYKQYEVKEFFRIHKLISRIKGKFPVAIFYNLLGLLYKRDK